jgi:hypothetical protein
MWCVYVRMHMCHHTCAYIAYSCRCVSTYRYAHLTMGIRFKKCVIRRFRHRANVIECTYTNLDSTAHYTHSLYDIAYCS